MRNEPSEHKAGYCTKSTCDEASDEIWQDALCAYHRDIREVA